LNRRNAVALLASTAVLALRPARAQQKKSVPARIPRIGYLLFSPIGEKPSPERAAFLRGLQDQGYIEGKNIAIEYRSAEWDLDQAPRLARELVDRRVDLIFAPTEELGRQARLATNTIPIVVGAMLDPVGDGIVPSLAHPGGNLTGLSVQSAELATKRLQLLKEVLPKSKRVAMFWDINYASGRAEWTASEKLAREMGITLQLFGVANADDYVKSFAAMAKDRPDALMAVPNTRMSAYRRIIAEFAETNRLPTLFAFSEYVDAGALMSYGPYIPDLFRRAASYVDKIFKGAKPGDLPIEQPVTFELVLNMKTAKAIGLTFPPLILARADRLVE